MKIVGLSDMHGDLPVIEQKCDVICICGDIVPLYIQRNIIKSIEWIRNDFRTWCDSIDCRKIIIIAGNHDFVFEQLVNDWKDFENNNDESIQLKNLPYDIDGSVKLSLCEYVENVLAFSDKMVYLHDTSIDIDGKMFYGTPYIPELYGWAFYESDENLEKLFGKIPNSVDVLLTHSPGKFVNDTGVSLQKYNKPEYGSSILTKCVQNKKIGLWLCGHVHSGNHKLEKYGDTLTANVSIKDERYDVTYEPLFVEI